MAKPLKYPLLLIALHWIVAMAVLVQLGLGLRISAAGPAPDRATLGWHAAFGLAILVMAAIRLLVRFSRPMPPLGGGLKGWIARAEYTGLYILMVLTPLAWIAAWSEATRGAPLMLFGVVDVAFTDLPVAALHPLLGLILGALVLAHIFAVMCRFLLDGPAAVQRILPGRDEGPSN